ncbi:carboxypeptidase-like regulatory domain-containing protein [Bernardetia sp. MNP-M8]|uniref:carboxypeptidase-like regulatory domain-containing protein n=1 Tax=Bernardetia sp. MNP-M8 TaxID=3127470 RepID=UPI0030CFC248
MKRAKIVLLFTSFLLVLLFGFEVLGQTNFLIKGKVIDSETKELLPFASIGIEGTSVGTASNSAGIFEFRLNPTWKDKFIVCSFVGYQPLKIKVSEAYQYSKSNQLVLELKSSESLKTVTISSKRIPKVEKIMKQVIKNLPENYPQTPYNVDFFYREYLKDSTAYVRLVEAALHVYDKRAYVPIIYNYKSAPTILNLEEDYFAQVKERRASYDYSKSKINNFFIDVEYGTKYNWIRKNQFIFDKMMYEKFDYELVNLTSIGKKTVYEISFSYNGTIDRFRKLKGKLFVNDEDYAVLQLHFSYLPVGAMGGYNAKERYGYNIYLENEEHFYFKKYDEKYLVSYQSLRSIEKYYESQEAFEESVSEYFVEQLTVNVNQKNPTPQDLQDDSKLKEIDYNTAFWESYNVLADSPLNIKIKADLEKRQSLEKQFELKK